MAMARKCDRCGNFYTNNKRKNKEIVFIKTFSEEISCCKNYDLCDHCADIIKEFLDFRNVVEDVETIKYSDGDE